jgi:signal transduction histidine kinase
MTDAADVAPAEERVHAESARSSSQVGTQPIHSVAGPAGRRRIGRLATRVPVVGTRVRILAAFALLTAMSAALSLLLIHRVLVNRLDEEISGHLTQEVAEFRRLVGGNDPSSGEPFGTEVRRIFDVYFARNVPEEGEVMISSIGGRIYRSARAADASYRPNELLRSVALEAPLDDPHSGAIQTPAGVASYVNVPVQIGDRVRATFTVANFPANERREIESAIMVAAQVFGAVLLLAFVTAWAVAGRVLAPLGVLRETAQSITETDLTQRIAVRGRDEVAQLARRFNDMLDRLERGFGAQRRFVDDAGHELRTPITIVRGHLELLSDDPDDRRETIALVLDELDRMSRIVTDLLFLARAEQRDFLHPAPVELAALTGELHMKAAAIAPRDWRLENVGTRTIVADRQRLTQAVIQLADNAAKHTDEGDVVAIGSSVVGRDVRIWVRDTGRGIADEDRTRIFDRFARGSSGRRTDGAGLGLSIVEAIARAHGGRVELSSQPREGATFTLIVPAGGPDGRS